MRTRRHFSARRILAARALLFVTPFSFAPVVAAENAAVQAAVDALNTRSFDDKRAAATELAGIDHPRAAVVLEALLAGELFAERGSGRLAIATLVDEAVGPRAGYALRDAVTDEDLGETGRRGARRVTVNNALRRYLRGLVAGLRLRDADPGTRIAAVRAVADAADPALGSLLRERLAVETAGDVRAAIDTALTVFDLDSPDEATRLAAIAASTGNLDGTVRMKLTALANDDPDAGPVHSEAVRDAATVALAAIERTVARVQTVETILFGLSLGSILVLAAIGLSITFGVMGVINMAHGELIMLGAYTTYVVQTLMPGALEYAILVAIPAAFLVSGLVGVGIERGIIRFLYGRPLETLLATFGVSLILQQAVRSIFSPLNRAVATPEWMSGSWEIVSGLSFTYNRLYTLIFAGLLFVALLVILQRTRLGLEVRATMQNRSMARAMGVRSARVDALTFGLGAGIAGVAGVALSQLTNVGPNLGQGYIVDSFLVVVFGGVGNLWGTLVAGLSLGVVSKFLEPVTGAVVAKIVVLVFIILFIQKRPRGLFPQKGRAVET